MNARQLRQAARRMLEVVSAELADEHEASMLEGEEERAEVETWMTLHDNADGTFSGRFVIPEVHGHLLRNALEKLSSPNRLSRNRAGDVVGDETVPGMAQNLNWSERLGSAFVELIEHLPTTSFGPVGATLIATIDHQRLLDGLGSARLDSGAHISAGEARRLACGAGIVPAVLGGPSAPLDLGRLVRLHTETMRRALALTRHLRGRGLRTPVRLVRHPPPPSVEPRRPDQCEERHPAVRPPSPTSPRQGLRSVDPAHRRSTLP